MRKQINKETTAPYKYSGVMFQFITRDYINGSALNAKDIRIGDIIFVDYADKNGVKYKNLGKPKNQIRTDGIMEHVYVVTGKTSNSVAGILVSSNTDTFVNRSLSIPNKNFGYMIEFHVYRPLAYVQK